MNSSVCIVSKKTDKKLKKYFGQPIVCDARSEKVHYRHSMLLVL